MLEIDFAAWQYCTLPEMCDLPEMCEDTGHVLLAEDCLVPEMCDRQEMREDTGHILLAEECILPEVCDRQEMREDTGHVLLAEDCILPEMCDRQEMHGDTRYILLAEDCLVPQMCDRQEIYKDTGHILLAEDCDDTPQNTAGVACVHRCMPPVAIANILCSLDGMQEIRAGAVASKPLRIKTRKKKRNHSAKTVSVLLTHFHANSKPSHVDKQGLANKTGMSVAQVSMWFNNKRKRTCGAAAAW